ncbi:MAG: hypothetical protein U0L62_01255 [Paludibacteraceae bacterium]|nr:hypothetical protein [Paludibacteraceae bacterium]
MNIEWLNSRKKEILNPHDAQLFDEIIRCCEAGLLRAAYIMTWILIVESLRNKIEKLSLLGDARAIKAFENIEGVEKAKKSNDDIIIKKALECQVVVSRYSSDLTYFWEQRCLYAHPYQTAPKEADVILIISKALEMVLKVELIYHKEHITEIIENEVANFHIVPQSLPEQQEHIKHHLLLIRNEHYLFLYKTLFYQFCLAVEHRNKLIYQYLSQFIQILICDVGVDICGDENALPKQIATHAKKVWYLIALTPSLWKKIDQRSQDSLFNCILIPSEDNFICARCAYRVIENGSKLSPKNEKIYYDEMSKHDIESSWQYYFDHNELLGRIETEWISTFSFSKQAKYVNWLDSIQHDMSIFTPEDCRKLGVFLGECCVNNTFVAKDYVSILPDTLKQSTQFLIGMIESVFVNKNKFNLPRNCTKCILPHFFLLPNEEQDDLMSHFSILEVHTQFADDEYKEQLKDIVENNKYKISANSFERLNKLIDRCIEESFL